MAPKKLVIFDAVGCLLGGFTFVGGGRNGVLICSRVVPAFCCLLACDEMIARGMLYGAHVTLLSYQVT